jgi:hypothetical protein
MSYHSLLQSLRSELAGLKIDFVNNAICVWIEGFWSGIASSSDGVNWVVNEDVKKIASNYAIFKSTEKELLASNFKFYSGAYLLVNDATSKFVTDTYDNAFRNKKSDHSFVGQIGPEDLNNKILVLDAIEKPDNFDDLNFR